MPSIIEPVLIVSSGVDLCVRWSIIMRWRKRQPEYIYTDAQDRQSYLFFSFVSVLLSI